MSLGNHPLNNIGYQRLQSMLMETCVNVNKFLSIKTKRLEREEKEMGSATDSQVYVVYVLKIWESGYDDNIFVFRRLKDARAKVYTYFGLPTPKKITTQDISELEAKYFGEDKGYFTITEQRIIEGEE